MKFQIKDSKKSMEWIELLKFIKNLNTHITIMCTPTYMFIQIMDQSHVCMIDINIPSTWFHLYESENCTFSVMSSILVKVFGMYTMDSLIEVIINDLDKIHIHLLHELQQKLFAIPLMDIEQDVLSTNKNDTKLDFVMKTKVLDKYINELAMFGEEVEIECNDDKLFLQSTNHEGSLRIEIKNETLEEFNVIENYLFKGKYCIKYLQYISKLSIIYPNIHLFLDEESPLLITFEGTELTIKYYIAPKFSDES